MAIVAGLSRETIRTRVGYLLGGLIKITAASNGSTTTFVTDDVWPGDDELNGWWWLGTDAPNDEVQSRVVDHTYSAQQSTLTLYPAVTSTVSADTAELWHPSYNPVEVHNMINQAITGAYGMIYDPIENISLHTGGKQRFDIPSEFDMLTDIYARIYVDDVMVTPGGEVWAESVDADFTITQDTEDLLFGRTSTKFVIAGTVNDGDLASTSLGALDLSKYTHLEFPIKVRTAVAASDLVIRLSATVNGADTDKLIAVPAITATTDTWVRVAMDEATSSFDPSECTAIISVALEYNANSAANTIWIGEIRATRHDSEIWKMIPQHQWRIDKEEQDIVLMAGAGYESCYNLLKLVGGDNPALLNADATACEVPEEYVIYRAAGLLLQRPVQGENSEEARARLAKAGQFLNASERERRNFPILRNVRLVA